MDVSHAPTPRLWLVRHAQPLIAPGVCYGQLDVPADDEHTRSSAHQLNAALPCDIVQWRCSPLVRCTQLAQSLRALRAAQPLALEPDPRLQELGFGDWEGRAWNDIPHAEIQAWTDDFCDYRPDSSGESLIAMLQRVQSALQESCALALREQRDVLWITHAGVIRCVLWLMEHGSKRPRADQWTARAPAFGDCISLPISASFTDSEQDGRHREPNRE